MAYALRCISENTFLTLVRNGNLKENGELPELQKGDGNTVIVTKEKAVNENCIYNILSKKWVDFHYKFTLIK